MEHDPTLLNKKRSRGWERSCSREKTGSCGSRVFLHTGYPTRALQHLKIEVRNNNEESKISAREVSRRQGFSAVEHLETLPINTGSVQPKP